MYYEAIDNFRKIINLESDTENKNNNKIAKCYLRIGLCYDKNLNT